MKRRSLKVRIENSRQFLRRTVRFLNQDVWDIELTRLPGIKAVSVRMLRVVMLVFRGFKDDECSMHASALTFSTLMAVVPILALCLSMARGLGDADTAKRWIQGRVEAWTETFKVDVPAMVEMPDSERSKIDAVSDGKPSEVIVRNELAYRINTLVERGFKKVEDINFAKLGTVGLVLLIWMVIEVLGRVERSFNRVWGIVSGRSVWRRFTDYLSVLLILPILIVAAASMPIMDVVTRFMPDQTAAVVQHVVASGLFKDLVVVVMSTLTFTFVIMFIPNTSMRLHSGLAGGFVSAVLFLLWLWVCAMLQVGAARYGKIYGSFAVAPIVLAWVHVSWQIVLSGAEVAFAVENCETFMMEQNAGNANLRARLTLALMVVLEAARSMVTDAPPFDTAVFVQKRKVPVRFLNAVVDELVRGGFMAQISERLGVYVLLKAPGALPVHEILNTVMNSGAGAAELGLAHTDEKVGAVVEQALSGMDHKLQDVTIGSLLAV